MSGVFGLPPQATEADLEAALAKDQAVGQGIGAIRAAINPESYGGLWVSHTNGDSILHIAVTDPTVRDVISGMNLGIPIEFSSATNTLAELLSLNDRVIAEAPSLEGLHPGNRIEITAPDEELNRVQIGIRSFDDGLRSMLLSQYGGSSKVFVYKEAQFSTMATRQTAAPPMRAGLDVHTHYDGTVQFCTSGFMVEHDNRDDVAFTTAGHCLSTMIQPTYWYTGVHPNDVPLGSNAFISFGGRLDGAVVDSPDLEGWRSSAIWIGEGFVRRVMRVQESNQDAKGRPACAVGRTTDVRCGEIVDTNVSVRGSGVRLTKQILTNFVSRGGDSGGPVYNILGDPSDGKALAMGIVSTGTPTGAFTTYSHIETLDNQSPYHVRIFRD